MEFVVLPFLETHAGQQMEIDARLFEAYPSDYASPAIRFYGICPPAVTIGFHQSEESVFRLVGDRAIEVVRRPTGGRAVLHAGDLVYSVIGHTAGPLFGESTLDIYRVISKGVRRGIERLGIKLECVESSRIESSPLCFRLASKYELLHRGGKLCGGALLKRNGKFLFQGSILLDSPPPEYADLAAGSASVNGILGERITTDGFIESIEAGLREELGVEMREERWADCLDRMKFLFYNKCGANI